MNQLDDFGWFREVEDATRQNLLLAREVERLYAERGFPPLPKPAIIVIAERILLRK